MYKTFASPLTSSHLLRARAFLVKNLVFKCEGCRHVLIAKVARVMLIIIIIIIILFKSGNKAHKHKQETYRQTDKQYK